MTTPEGKIKAKITALLKSYGPACYYYMPVPTGYGKRTLDYLGSMRGWFFAIEAKANPEARLTKLQEVVAEEIRNANGFVFFVCDEGTLAVVKSTLDVIYHGCESGPQPTEYDRIIDVRHQRRAAPRP